MAPPEQSGGRVDRPGISGYYRSSEGKFFVRFVAACPRCGRLDLLVDRDLLRAASKGRWRWHHMTLGIFRNQIRLQNNKNARPSQDFSK